MLLDLDGIFDNDRPCAPRPTGMTPDELPSEWRAIYSAFTEAHLAHGRHREHAEHFAMRDVLARTQQSGAPVSS